MVRGGRGYSRGNSYRGSSNRGGTWNAGGYGRNSRDRYSSFDGGYDKGRFNDRYGREEYPKPYRMDNYPRERHSPERKRPRNEGPSRHEYGGRYEPYPSERRGYSGERDRHLSSPYASRREDFRKPPPPSPRGGGRGRLSSRGPRGLRRERGGGPPRRRLADRSYAIRKRGLIRSGEFSRRSSKLIRIRSNMRRKRVDLSSEKESSGEDEEKEDQVKKEKSDGDEDVEMKEGGAENEGEEGKEAKEGAEGEEKPKEKKEKKTDDDVKKKPVRTFIKLVCPQCNIKVTTFRRYEAHLQGQTHLFGMRKVAAKQRNILAQMRQAQRNAQNELEKSGEGITDHTVFCPLCKLNYKQERAVHQATSAHKNMKKFLLPNCKACKTAFKSPMVYEHHLCSVEHLKRKQKMESAGDGEEDNLDEFTTIDSVGEVGDETTPSAEELEREEKKKKKVSVGIEQIKKIEAYYCDLCRMFLPRGTENEYPDILAGHCRKRFHMQRYIRFKENEDLKKRAEKLQRKETAEKAKKDGDVKKEGADDPAGADVKVEGENKDDESKEMDTSKSADDDKLWDAVDKDLGELLEETDGREDDDDEERVNGERYDRFKSAEKEKNGEIDEEGAETSQKPEEVKKDEESKK